MKRRLAISAAALIIAAGLALPAQSQQSAGGISAVWGQALVHRDSSTGWAIAQPGQPLMPGDSVLAAQGSRLIVALGDAAITLHPGAQLDWAGQNGPTPVIRLDQGHSEISLPPSRWNNGLNLLTPWGMARLEQPGTYGVNLDRNGHIRLVVWSGFASLPSMGLEVQAGQMALLTANGAALAMAPSQEPVVAPAAVYVPDYVVEPEYQHERRYDREREPERVVMPRHEAPSGHGFEPSRLDHARPEHIQAEQPHRQESRPEFHHPEPQMHAQAPARVNVSAPAPEPHHAEPEHPHQQAQAQPQPSSPPPAPHDHDHGKPDRK